MNLAIMQPYFFPYLGYFSLVTHSDSWVVFDTAQYTPKTWMNRNRVLHPSSGCNWVTVPLSNGSRSIRISEALVGDPEAARTSVLGKLSHYRRRAPHFVAVEELVRGAFGDLRDRSLVNLNVRSMQAVCDYLEIAFHPRVCSELALDLGEVEHPGGWAPAIASALGADDYLNPIGGRELFDPAEFAAIGVGLWFLEQPPMEYATGPYAFEPGLSILDVLMWNTPTEVRAAMERAICHPAARAA